MKPKMKKNRNYHRDNEDGIGVDKKNLHRRERRVFNPTTIKRYYTEHLEPKLIEEMEEDDRRDFDADGK